MPSDRPQVSPYVFAVIGLISCSMLTYEVLLTRICSLRLYFHFGFLIISNCLLGIGASGTLISIYQDAFKKRARTWISVFVVFYVVTLATTYPFLLKFDFGFGYMITSIHGLLRLSIYNFVATVPFFFAGGVIGMILTFNAARVNVVYFVDLLGAGLGCLLCPLLLARFGAGGAFVFLTMLAVVGGVFAFPPKRKTVAIVVGLLLIGMGGWLLPRLDRWFPVSSKSWIDFTDQVGVALDIEPDYSAWSSNSRVDLLSLQEKDRFIFGLGEKTLARYSIPEEKAILQDGTAGTYILNFSENPDKLQIIRESLYSVAVRLKDNPRCFIIGVGGGNDVWAAKIHGASRIKGIELNRQVLDIHTKVLPHYSRELVNDARIELVNAEGRSALMREKEKYDVVQMTAIDTWSALVSGAYVLAENYLYTKEALANMYDHLDRDGIMYVTRVGDMTESLRTIATIHEALESRGVRDFRNSIMCVRNRFLIGILVKKGVFTRDEVRRTGQFVLDGGLTPAYLPGQKLANQVSDFILIDDKEAYIRWCKTDISATTDDKPYFFFFYKWKNPFKLKSYKTRALPKYPMSISLILWQLLISSVLSILLIVVPLVVLSRKGLRQVGFKRFLIYFAGLGLGFIMIEVALMQKLTLFLGHPLYSITVTLFSILIFTGLGSLLSARLFDPPDRKVLVTPIGLALLLTIFVFLSPKLVSSLIGLPLLTRIAITIGILAPISLLMGVPFAYGIRLLDRQNPSLIPWAWAVNGCLTVIGAIATVILSMNLGFTMTLIIAVLIYFVAFGVLTLVDRSGGA